MFLVLSLLFITGVRFLQKMFMDLVKAKVDVEKSCQELKQCCQELEISQHLSEAVRRSVIEEYMQPSYFRSVILEIARRAAGAIREDLRSRNLSMDLSFMSLR